MFTPDQTGRFASPLLDLEKTVCGSCAVCKLHLNSSADSRLLPCLHAVCNTCLTKICTDGDTQDCPLCAQSFSLSEVTECAIFEDSSNNNKAPKCAGCEESEVNGWCVQCDEALCLDCMSAHRRVKVTRDHEVTPKKPPSGWVQRRRCSLHTQESLRFFCLVCEELTCKDCQLITHRGHSFVQQEEAVGSQRQQLQSLLNSIRHQKESVSSSLLLLEARLQDIEDLKVAAKKMLRQVVQSIYQALVLKASQILKEIEALYSEEGKCLLERKTSLNRLEGCQDYIAAFIGKILSTEGHCFLVHKKRIDTQVRKILSQQTCTPETMIKLHVQLQNDICQHIIKLGFMKIRKIPVPFTSLRIGSTQAKSVNVESSNPNSKVTATDGHPVAASSIVNPQVQGECVVNSPALRSCDFSQTVQMNQALKSLPHPSQPGQPSQSNQATIRSACTHVASSQLNQSKLPSLEHQNSFSSSPPSIQVQSQEGSPTHSKHAYSPSSSNGVPFFPKSVYKTQINPYPSGNSEPRFTNCTSSQINNTLAKSRSASTLHYYPPITHPMAVNNQTPAQTYTIPCNNQAPASTHPVCANLQSPILTDLLSANTQTHLVSHPVPANNQTPLLTHPISANNQTSFLTSPISANNQTIVLTNPVSVNNQTPLLTYLVGANNQTPKLNHAIPGNNQALKLTQPIPANNQTPVVTHPVSNMSTDTQTLILTCPIQTRFLTPINSFAAQPNIPLTVLSTTNTLSLTDVTAVSNVHSAGPSSGGLNCCSQNPCAQNTTSPTFKAIQSIGNGSSLPVNPTHSAPISGSDTLWCKRNANNTANRLVNALADSVCDQDTGVSSTNFTDMDNSESNLPTSTVPETDPKESSPDPSHSSGPSNVHQGSLSTTTEKRQAQAGQSFKESDSRLKHWSAGMPTTFRQLVETACTSVSSTRFQNATPPVNSTPCGTSEDLECEKATHHKTVQSNFDHSKQKVEDKESAVTVEQFKRSPLVSLVRLPISLPPCGQPLPEFHLTTDISRDHILVQESQGGQIKQVWRWHEDPISSRASPCSVLQSSNSSPASDVQFCAVCQSAGAALLCAKCGCAFHSDCHIPPILTTPSEDWVCLLCQDVNEMFVYDNEEMRTSSLSLQDQRKCEKLLLSLLCDENRWLLYSVTKNHSKTAEFDIILGRLLGTRRPSYRTAAELVSDVWTLFDILMMNSEKKNMVVKLQESFQQQLNESFGKSLHASLLKHSSSDAPRSSSETETQREKHRNTLKRMREFFMENCGTAAKKSSTDKRKESEGCGNTIDEY